MAERDTFVTVADGDQLNDGYFNGVRSAISTSITQAGLNTVRQLQDRSIDLTADGGEFADVYTVWDGKLKSIALTSATDASYDSTNGKYYPTFTLITGDTTHTADTWTNEDNAFDNDPTTFAQSGSSGDIDRFIGKTFSAKTVKYVTVRFSWTRSGAGEDGELQTYDGATWNTVKVYPDDGSGITEVYDTVFINSSIQGVRIGVPSLNANNVEVYNLNYSTTDATSTATIVQTIPSGTFSSTISQVAGTALVEDWEDGNSIQYKLTNGSEDSGWLDYNDIQEFTAFTSEPTTLTVRLIPKSTSPTTGYPSINGFFVREL